MLAGLLFCLVLLALVPLAFAAGIRYVATPSVPIGFWRTTAWHPGDGPLARGTFVELCLPEDVATFGKSRTYIAAGSCPGNAEPLMKRIAAVPGDRVILTDAGLFVNGTLLAGTRPFATDSHGRPLPGIPRGERRVGAAEYWVIGTVPRSWDSRYWGAVPSADIRSTAQPLWLTG
jgi:conjugative transfer signal peptidase TraF